ncbi:MAG: aminotransferase class V-fold PLP-dependent enzyme [Acidobacteria bacterium]|nr:MAG: aminotransferase class V-fold PLP-dependent enzyme [Acidobacteriota bacterium]
MTIDLERARRETPGCEQVIHFNNAGAALMPRPVLDAVIGHLQLEAHMGGYEAAERARPAIEHVYDAVAELIGCHRDEVALVENATRAWDMAFYAIPFAEGDRILTGMAEYASNYIAFLQVARRTGVRIEVIPNDEHGQISVTALRQAIDERVKLIAITHVPTNGGLVNPAAAVGRVAREAGILYLLDACQSIGQMPIDVNAIGCDILSATGRKFLRGPRGTGFLYVRREVLHRLEPPFLDLHAAQWTARDRYEIRPDARRFESWEANYAGHIGLGVAIDYALGWGLEAIWARVTDLAATLRRQLEDIPGVTIRDLGTTLCGIVSFTVDGRDAETIRKQLARHRINVSVSQQSSTRLDMEARGLSDLVRASVHYYNSENEIERFCATLRSIV